MDNVRIAVKAFTVKDGKALILKRRPNDVHKPAEWDIPGGRLDLGEDPIKGVEREAEEEIGIDIDILLPIEIQHFTRDDGQIITMIIFLCKPLTDDIKLSEEHTEFKWLDINEQRDEFPEWMNSVIDNMLKYKLDEHI
jgi:8-oxo-dGTP diphosphatase